MSTTIGEIDGYEDTFIVTQFCGPATLLDASGNKDRLCLQVGDDLKLDRQDATELRDMLSRWLGDEVEQTKARLVRMPWGAWLPRKGWVRVRKQTVYEPGWYVDIRFGKNTETSPRCEDQKMAEDLADDCASIINGVPKKEHP